MSKFSEAVRQLLERELVCPYCGSYNTHGQGGLHIDLDEYGLAVCRVCGGDFRPPERTNT